MKFEINKVYKGIGPVGNCEIEVVSRTAKMITIKTTFGINKLRIKTADNGLEYSLFKCWGFDAGSEYSIEDMTQDAYDTAYCS
jgi:hypothetical protein